MTESTNIQAATTTGGKRRLTRVENIILERVAGTGQPLAAALQNDQKLNADIYAAIMDEVREDLIEERLLDNNEYLRLRIAAGK